MDYPSFVDRLFRKRHIGDDGLMHAAVGISGEAGELLDAVKKLWVYGKPLDVHNCIEELGDLEFYLEAFRQRIGTSRDEVIAANVAKLTKRYPSGYTDQAAIERADKARDASTSWQTLTANAELSVQKLTARKGEDGTK